MVTSGYVTEKLNDAMAALALALKQGSDEWKQIGTATSILTTLQNQRADKNSIDGIHQVVAREGDLGGGG
jgi:hypothetical protein